jgi:hypothetical protein
MDTTWLLSGRTIEGNIPVEITVRNENVLSFEPEQGVIEPIPHLLLGFAKLSEKDGDVRGRSSMISYGRRPDVTYDEATEEGVSVTSGELFPYFLGAGSYDLLLAITIDSFVQLP